MAPWWSARIERTVADRRRLGFAGMVSVALAVSERGELMCHPRVMLTGVPEADRLGHRIEDVAYDAAVQALKFDAAGAPTRPVTPSLK